MRSSLVVAAGIVVLLAGMSLVSAAQDAISGFPVTAAARAFELVTLTVGIVVGIAGVLDLAQRAQVPLAVVDTSASPVPFAVALAASFGIAGFWAVVSHARPRAVGLAAVAGALSWTTFWAAGGLGAGPVLASGVAAVVLGFCGEVLTGRLRIPPQLIAVCGIVPLLPGWRSMTACSRSSSTPTSTAGWLPSSGPAPSGWPSPPASRWVSTWAGR